MNSLNGINKREFGAYYTKSNEIIEYIIKRLELENNLSVLEPSAGDGDFLQPLIKKNLKLNITALDINPVCTKILKKEYPSVVSETIDTTRYFPDKKWDRIFGNPPYGAKINPKDKKEYSKLYPEINVTESYALFLVNCIKKLKEKGILSFIISDTFLHLNSHVKLRKFILDNCNIKEIVLLKTKLFPSVNYQYAGLCIITLQKCKNSEVRNKNKLRFVNRINDIKDLEKLKESSLEELPSFLESEIIPQENYSKFISNVFYQAKIPKKILELFMDHVKTVEDLVDCKTGIYCGDNKKHFRILDSSPKSKNFVNAGYKTISEKEIITRKLTKEEKDEGIVGSNKFIPLMKGGSGKYYKKPTWFIDWSRDSLNFMLKNKKARVQNSNFYFLKGISMSLINSNRQQARIMGDSIFDQSDNGYFPKDKNLVYFFLGFFNSRLFNYMLKKVINPTANATVNYVKKIPVIIPNRKELEYLDVLVKKIIEIKKRNDKEDTSIIEESIDKFFYRLYGLDDKEREIIELFCYHLR